MNAVKAVGPEMAKSQQRKSPRAPAAPLKAEAAQRLGNQHLLMLLRARLLQAKLTVSHPQDAYEQEADRVAEHVMRMPDLPNHVGAASAPLVQRKCHKCEEELKRSAIVQRSEGAATEVPTVDAATEHSINALSGRGSPLPASVRSFMEPRFNLDFSAVRVHTDPQADELARGVNARAFTVGPHIVFGAGHYAPHSDDGKRLLAHELTHVGQQGAAPRSTSQLNRAVVFTASTTLQRAPSTPVSTEGRRERHLEELALDPGAAHGQWPRLNPHERSAVVKRMRRHFGDAFADQFLALANVGGGHAETIYWQPGAGPNPQRLVELGYRRGGLEVTGTGATEVEIWVHPTGKMIRRDISTFRFEATDRRTTPPGQDVEVPPPPEVPPKEPPTDSKAEALAWLREMQTQNERLRRLCNTGGSWSARSATRTSGEIGLLRDLHEQPFLVGDAEDAMNEFNNALFQLSDRLSTVDMRSVDPTFWKKVEAEKTRNAQVREPCCEKAPDDPIFDCEEIVGPDYKEEKEVLGGS